MTNRSQPRPINSGCRDTAGPIRISAGPKACTRQGFPVQRRPLFSMCFQTPSTLITYIKSSVKCASNDINSKLTALGMFAGSPLYEKHRRLNRFYNATKHARTVDNQNCRLRLASRDGRRIAVDYFETVRRIFRWYYRKYAAGIPDWDELKPISYRDHGFSYRFKHSDRW
jgi:hypothetical protein